MSLQTTTAAYLAKVGITTDPGTFGLHVDRPVGATSNTVTWTWPPGMLAGFQAIPATVVFFLLTLQRAGVALNRPNAAVLYNVGSNQAPAADTRWTTLQTWNNGQFLVDPVAQGSGYTDPWPAENGVAHYRLILNFAKAGDPVIPPFSEMAWNVPILIPPYTMFQPPPSQPTTLTWTAPQLFLNFISASRSLDAGQTNCSDRMSYKISLPWPFTPLPARYRVFKSIDRGATYQAVTGFAGSPDPLGSVPAWYDSDCHNPIYYRFMATESDGTTLDSNTVIASY